jgi:sulfite reductase (NADPH) flavoprotein alpha-component
LSAKRNSLIRLKTTGAHPAQAVLEVVRAFAQTPFTESMSFVPFIPENAPFTPAQRAWLNGFLAGAFSQAGAPAAATSVEAKPLLILFGSQSGGAEGVAKKLGKGAPAKGYAPRVVSLDAFKPADLAAEPAVLIVTSTWGEGDMPDNAVEFWKELDAPGFAARLENTAFSVLALGDKNYGETFCLAGKKFDTKFAALGARRIAPLVECDVDYDEPAAKWSESVFAGLLGGPAVTVSESTSESKASEETGYSRKRPFPAPLSGNRRLTASESDKDVRHIEFTLDGSGLEYEAGDALGLMPRNCPQVVSRVIEKFGLNPIADVALPEGGVAPLAKALEVAYCLAASLAAPKPERPVEAAGFVSGLRKLQPRLYSIASSPKTAPGKVCLTVGVVKYATPAGEERKGVASTFLAERLDSGETAGVFIHKAAHFRLPENPETPVIMVGPGTGIAPFRAFLEERAATAAKGKNWLFFGDRRASTDFLYQEQLEGWVQSGHTRLDCAFSRDSERKVYVQHLMADHAAELWKWLNDGAHFYVCGDASKMAKDVDAALHKIAETAGGLAPEAAAEFVNGLRKNKRYQRDVY